MDNSLAKFAPSAALFAVLGYLAWCYLDLSPPAPSAANKMPEISAEMLRPTPLAETARDPFGDSLPFELGEVSNDRPGRGKQGKAAGGAKPDVAARAAGAKVATADGRPGNAAANSVSETRTSAALKPADAAAQEKGGDPKTRAELVLNATLLHGEQRIALINGRAYHLGDSINTTLDKSATAIPFKLAEIHHHRVVLARDTERLTLSYADQPMDSPGNKPAAGGPKGNAGKPPRPTTTKPKPSAQ